jgi:hypothetical protein
MKTQPDKLPQPLELAGNMYVTFCLLLVVTCFGSGCATTGHDDTSVKTVEDKKWEDLTTAQKIGYSMWLPLQWGLYFGGAELGSKSGSGN